MADSAFGLISACEIWLDKTWAKMEALPMKKHFGYII